MACAAVVEAPSRIKRMLARYGMKTLFFLLLSLMALSLIALLRDNASSDKLFDTASALAALTAAAQLQIAGVFEKHVHHFGDEKLFPYGPPSHFTRRLVDGERPIRMWINNHLFYDARVGAAFAIASPLLSIAGTWAK